PRMLSPPARSRARLRSHPRTSSARCRSISGRTPTAACGPSFAGVSPNGVKDIADTGLLVAAADPHDRDHAWAAEALRSRVPFYTCEAVLLETAWILEAPGRVLTLVARGDLILDPAFQLAVEVPRLLDLCRNYADRDMDLADACLVRMSELTVRC